MERNPSALAVAPAATLVTIAGVLALRRILGETTGNLPAGEAVFYCGLFAAAAGFLARRYQHGYRQSVEKAPDAAPWVAAFLVSLLFCAGLSGDPVDALAGLVTISVILAALALMDGQRRRAAASPRSAEIGVSRGDTPSLAEPVPDDADASPVAQSMTRREMGGVCLVEGMLTFEIPPGEQVHQLHVPFWPALDATPEVECELDDIEGRVRIALAAAHGLRIEVRLNETRPVSQRGVVHFSACAPASRAAA